MFRGTSGAATDGRPLAGGDTPLTNGAPLPFRLNDDELVELDDGDNKKGT